MFKFFVWAVILAFGAWAYSKIPDAGWALLGWYYVAEATCFLMRSLDA